MDHELYLKGQLVKMLTILLKMNEGNHSVILSLPKRSRGHKFTKEKFPLKSKKF